MKIWKNKGYKVFAEDEAVISMNPTSRKLWAPEGSKPIQPVSGSHQNVCFFAVVSDDINHCCTADWLNEDSFISFLKYLSSIYEKIVVIVDHATHHVKSQKVKMFVKEHDGNLIIWRLPKRLFEDRNKLGDSVKNHIEQEFKINLAKFWQ